MHVVTKYPDNVFCWIDLTTNDVDGAKAFYSGLFGWDYDDRPLDDEYTYTQCQIDGKRVAGMSAMMPDMEEQGVPPMWNSYVKHDDVDSVVAKATEAGGTVIAPPMDILEEGRMAVIQDSTGAMVGVWQPKNHTGAQLVNMPNAWVWNELVARDKAPALTFYNEVFGWGDDEDPTGYTTFSNNGRVQAGMLQMDESMAGIPNHWGVYFMTDDVQAAMAKVKELGGTVHIPPTQAGELGKFIVAADPQGATFTVIQFDGEVDDPPQA